MIVGVGALAENTAGHPRASVLVAKDNAIQRACVVLLYSSNTVQSRLWQRGNQFNKISQTRTVPGQASLQLYNRMPGENLFVIILPSESHATIGLFYIHYTYLSRIHSTAVRKLRLTPAQS